MDEPPTPYGHELAPDLREALRGPVPAEVLRWVEAETGDVVVDERALEGGTSSAVHRLVLAGTGGARREVVLRRFVLDWVRDEPWAPRTEALALELLAGQSAIAVPRLVASDLDGGRTGTPAILMTALPGRVVWNPDDLDGWLRRIAELLIPIHALPVDPRLADWGPYASEGGVPPAWTRDRGAWETALELWEAGPPRGDRVFLHRDFHPGNILWTGTEVSGVVDWVSACAGPPEEDVAHCRANLASRHGLEVADRFLRLWLDLTGRDGYDPYYDLTTVVSMSAADPDPGIDEFVAAAGARIR
jgi:aminoglycoside phosphotransferase (APT) family kinase protein